MFIPWGGITSLPQGCTIISWLLLPVSASPPFLDTATVWTALWNPGKVMEAVEFSSVKSLTYVQLFVTPCTVTHQASLSITNSQSLLKLMSIESVMSSKLLCLMSESPSGKREGFQDNATCKKREVYYWLEPGLLPHPTQWCRVRKSPSPTCYPNL